MTQIFFILETILIMCKRTNSRELSIVNEWFCVNKFSLNLEKTHFILFTNCKSVKIPVIKINDNVIERVIVTKNLGIYINENLSWMDHISYISNKLSKSIAILHCVNSIINMDALRNNNNNNNNGYFYVLFLRRAHSPFIKNKKIKTTTM